MVFVFFFFFFWWFPCIQFVVRALRHGACLRVRIMWAIDIGPVHVYMQVHACVRGPGHSLTTKLRSICHRDSTVLQQNMPMKWKVLVLRELSAIENHYYKPVHLYMFSLSGHASLDVQETILVMLYTDHTTGIMLCTFFNRVESLQELMCTIAIFFINLPPLIQSTMLSTNLCTKL